MEDTNVKRAEWAEKQGSSSSDDEEFVPSGDEVESEDVSDFFESEFEKDQKRLIFGEVQVINTRKRRVVGAVC